MKDSYYTPTILAQQLVGYVRKRNLRAIADFCVGDGELLRAAEAKWETSEYIATDISEKALNGVKKQHPNWIVGKCDFQNLKSQNICKALRTKLRGIDLILLNPPFSCIGGTRHKILLDGAVYNASTALVFIVESLKYLSEKGCIYAILPSSVAYSERDECLWNKLVQDYNLKILDKSSDKHFEGCTPNILFVSLNSQSHQCIFIKPKILIGNFNGYLNVFRGKLPMSKIKDRCVGRYPLVHSTNLHKQKITRTNVKIKADTSEVVGPALLLPRVGNPRKDKLCILPRHKTVVLSDCVIAIKTKTLSDSKKLQKILLDNWSSFSNLYQGTGAKYITIGKIKYILGIDK